MPRRRRRKHQAADPVERIHRLIHALGTGPHAANVSLEHHIRTVLKSVGDQAALDILNGQA